MGAVLVRARLRRDLHLLANHRLLDGQDESDVDTGVRIDGRREIRCFTIANF